MFHKTRGIRVVSKVFFMVHYSFQSDETGQRKGEFINYERVFVVVL